MNTSIEHQPQTPPTKAMPAARPGFYQRAIEEALSKMPLGCLEVTLPDGSVRHFGNAPHPTARLRVLRPGFFKRCVLFGDIGFGEAYVDGDWDTDDLPAVLAWFIENVEHAPGMSGSKRSPLALNLLRGANRVKHLLRPNSVQVSRRNIAEHYDLGNDFYRLWLDPSMTYSSGLFVSPELTLEQAQIAKYDALCRNLRLKPTDHLLEIGSGWGGMACHAAKHYGCRITTLTISEAQLAWCKERFAREGVADRVEVRLQDYRHTTGLFDKIVSIEMLEAVGERYVDGYFAQCARLLKRDGLLALQYITSPDSRYDQFRKGVDWIQKHVFPGSLLMSVGRVTQALQRGTDLHLHNLHDMGHHYARTLREWRARFNAHHPELRRLRFDDHFIRKWNYYLSYCEAAFAQRNISVVQAVYTRPNNRTLI